MKIKIALIHNDDDWSYTVYVPSLKGCVSEGKTKDEDIKNIKEAIELYLEDVEDDAVLEAELLEEVTI